MEGYECGWWSWSWSWSLSRFLNRVEEKNADLDWEAGLGSGMMRLGGWDLGMGWWFRPGEIRLRDIDLIEAWRLLCRLG